MDSNAVSYTCKNCQCIPYYPELHVGDEGRCGLWPFETGTWDPSWLVCRRHDAKMQAQADGLLEESILETQAKFALGEVQTGIKGLWAAGTFLPMILIGVGVGTPMAVFRWLRGKKTNSRYESE